MKQKKIELLAGQHGKDSEFERFPRNSNNSIAAANLLKGVEKFNGVVYFWRIIVDAMKAKSGYEM